MQEAMPCLECNPVRNFNRKLRLDGNIQFCMKSVPQPSHPHFGDALDPRRMVDRVPDFINDFRVYPVKHASKDRLSGFPCDAKNRYGDKQTDNGICQWIAQPDADSTEEHG